MQQPEFIKMMAKLMEKVYPEAYAYLFTMFKTSERNHLYHLFLITERFIRCNFGSNDTLTYDISQGQMNI